MFFLTDDFGGLWGELNPHAMHRHYTVQLTVSDQPFTTHTPSASLTASSVIIGSNVPHQLEVQPAQQVLLLNANPLGKLGGWAKAKLGKATLAEGASELCQALWQRSWQVTKTSTTKPGELAGQLEQLMAQSLEPLPLREPSLDERIRACLQQLEQTRTILPASDMAASLALSTSRFLHLFKQETGLTYRRMGLWFKLVHSFRCYRPGMPLTELAHRCGFADSAHYARTFKETFGLTPSQLFKR